MSSVKCNYKDVTYSVTYATTGHLAVSNSLSVQRVAYMCDRTCLNATYFFLVRCSCLQPLFLGFIGMATLNEFLLMNIAERIC